LININRRRRHPCHELRRRNARRDIMHAGWKISWLAAIVFAAAFLIARLLVPDVVPIGYADEAQASWAVLTAFMLRAIELTAAWVGAIALGVMLAMWASRRLGHRAPR
jgi:hypothetical protein